MKSILYPYCILLFACYSCHYQTNADIYSPTNFARITSIQDSVKEMRVIYRSTIDEKRYMIRTYYDDGSLIGISYYKNQKRDGHWVQYFESRLSFEGDFSNGQKVGLHKYYFPSGQPSSIEEYENGKMVSKIKYSEDGKVISTEKTGIENE